MSDYDILINWLETEHPEVLAQWATLLDDREPSEVLENN